MGRYYYARSGMFCAKCSKRTTPGEILVWSASARGYIHQRCAVRRYPPAKNPLAPRYTGAKYRRDEGQTQA